MKFKFSTIILLLMVIAPFDLLVLKFLPLPEKVYGFARFGVEFAIYGIFFFLILRNMVFGKLLTRTPIDIPLILFFAVSILSIVVNRVPIGPALVGWRDLWRFVVLYYVLTNINLDERFHRKVIAMFVVIGCMQGGIALYQHFAGIDKFFLPRATTVEIAGKVTNYKLLAENNKTYEKGSGVGTICDAVQLANYLLICLAVVVPLFLHYSRITWHKRMFNLIAFGLIMVGIFMSYSRISTLFALLSIFITFIVARELRRLFPIAITGALIVIIALAVIAIVPSNKSSTYYNPRLKETSPIENFTQIFSSSLAEKSFETSRGYVIANALPALFKSLNLIGYGPDVDNSLYKLVQKDLDNATPFANYMIINDVYWIGMITCYGIIGVGIFIFILYRLFRMGMYVFKNTPNMYAKYIALAFITILILAIPYTAVIRTFAFRMFAMYFWMLAGIVASEYRTIKEFAMMELEEEELATQQKTLVAA